MNDNFSSSSILLLPVYLSILFSSFLTIIQSNLSLPCRKTMASVQRTASSGSEGVDPRYAGFDERKRKRMLSNRESARRCRVKKQKQLEDLTSEISLLKVENGKLFESIKAREEAYVEIESVNNVLRAQTRELTDRLRFLNSILEIAEEVSGFSVEIPEIPDTLLNPWQLPLPVQPIMASAFDIIMH